MAEKDGPIGVFDPSAPRDFESGLPQCKVGRKVFLAVGTWRFTSQNGNPTLEIHAVCVEDLEVPPGDTGDRGNVAKGNVTLMRSTAWKIGQVIDAFAWTEKVDMTLDADVLKVISSRPFVGVVAENVYNGKTYANIESFELWPAFVAGADDPEAWDAPFNAASEAHKAYVARKVKFKARDEAKAAGHAHTKSGESSQAKGATDTSQTSQEAAKDADIPFKVAVAG